MSEEHKGIRWGGLIKGLLATAAVVGGIELVFPGTAASVVSAVKEIGIAIGDKISGIASASTEAVKSAATTTAAGASEPFFSGEMAKNIGWVAAKLGGIVLAVSGLKYLLSDKETPAQDRAEERESFAAREDMRRMQALMVARMQAQGYQPAMAMAGQGR